MITLAHRSRISIGELRAWAYDDDASPPANADPNIWDLILTEWCADDALFVEFAGDERAPKRAYFLGLLRQRLVRRCAQTRWLASSLDRVLAGTPAARWLRSGKGRGKKEKARLKERAAIEVAENAEQEAKAFAEGLLRRVRGQSHPDLHELATRLDAFLADPTTIKDSYWGEYR